MSEAVKHENLVDALIAAQAEFPEIPKDKLNKHFGTSYASLDAIITATRPALTKHGLALTQTLRAGDSSAAFFLVTTLHHSTGTMEALVPIYFDAAMQSLGGAMTYGRRYGAAGLLNIAADEDDDGNSTSRPPDQRQAGAASRGQRNGKQQKQEAKPAEQSAEQPQDSAADQKPQTFTLDQFKKTIDNCKNPDRMVTFIDKCGSMQQLIDDQEMTQAVFDHAADVLRSHREAGTWEADACDFLSKRLSHNYNALAMESDAAKPQLTFETIAAQIDGIIKSRGLCEYLTRAESSETLLSDIPLLKRLIEKAGQVAYARLQGGKWKATEVDEVEAIISRIKLKIDGTKPETSGTQGELIP